jgi:hypothetical protein
MVNLGEREERVCDAHTLCSLQIELSRNKLVQISLIPLCS